MNTEKKFFACSNTGNGFVSYFEEVFGECEKIYIIKGGPGTGKNRLIRSIADEGEKAGEDIEYYYCSSDPFSLDGIILKNRKTAVIDGTSPHSYEPVYPGIKENLIDLGSSWDEFLLMQNERKIKELTDEKKVLYGTLYNYLAASCRVVSSVRSNNVRLVKSEKLSSFCKRITKGIKNGNGYKKTIRLTDNMTSMGYIEYDTLENMAENVYYIRDKYCVADVLMKMLIKVAKAKGIEIICSPSYLDTSCIKSICIPSESLCFTVTGAENNGGKIINMERFIDTDALKDYKQKIRFAYRCFVNMKNGAEKTFDEIRTKHSELEKCYIRAMDFSKNDAIILELKEEIFG